VLYWGTRPVILTPRPALQIVGNQQLRRAAEETEHAHVGAGPVRQRLRNRWWTAAHRRRHTDERAWLEVFSGSELQTCMQPRLAVNGCLPSPRRCAGQGVSAAQWRSPRRGRSGIGHGEGRRANGACGHSADERLFDEVAVARRTRPGWWVELLRDGERVASMSLDEWKSLGATRQVIETTHGAQRWGRLKTSVRSLKTSAPGSAEASYYSELWALWWRGWRGKHPSRAADLREGTYRPRRGGSG
jgi:hypothetical protein